MKALIVTGAKSVRGGHRVLTTLARELNTRGHKAVIAAATSQEHKADAGIKELWKGVPTLSIKTKQYENSDEQDWEKVQSAAHFLKAHAGQYDRIVLDSWHASYASMLAGVLDKSIQLVQSYPAFKPESAAKIWRAAYFDLLPRVPMRRIAVSKYLAGELQRVYGQKSVVVEPFIHPLYFESAFTYRDEKPLKLIASASTWKPGIKGLDFLMRSLSKFRGFPFTLTLVSGEPMPANFKPSFPVSVRSAAKPEVMVELLLDHDIYLSASTNEAFHMSLAEAMAMGMPVVALDSGGNRDYIRSGKNALMAKNQKEFLQGLKVLERFTIRTRMGQAAQKTVQKYSLKHMVHGFVRCLGLV